MTAKDQKLSVIRIAGSSRRGGRPDSEANVLFRSEGLVPMSGHDNTLYEGACPPEGKVLDFTLNSVTPKAGRFKLCSPSDSGPVLLAEGNYFDVANDKKGHLTIKGSCAPVGKWGQLSQVTLVCKDPAYKPAPADANWHRPAKKAQLPVAPPAVAQAVPTIALAAASQAEVKKGYTFVRFDTVPVAQVCRFEDQPRKEFHQGKLELLARSIKRSGLRKPIQIRELEPSEPEYSRGYRHQLVDGERRLRAHKIAKLAHVQAIVVKVANKEDQFATSFILNFFAEPHSDYEIASAVIRMVDQANGDVLSVAEDCGKTTSWVYSYLVLKGLHPDLFALLDPTVGESRKLRLGHARVLARVELGKQLAAYAEAKQLEGKGVKAMDECLAKWDSAHRSEVSATGRKRRGNRPAHHLRVGVAAANRLVASAQNLSNRLPSIRTAFQAVDGSRKTELVERVAEAIRTLEEVKKGLLQE